MNHTLLERAKVFLQAHKNKSIWKRITASLAAVVVFVTTYMLILPAITMERPTICGLEEHTHAKSCYVSSLKEALHEHDESCYDANGNLACQRPAVRLHEHTDECYKDANLICGQTAYQGHAHTDACYTWEKVLVCGEGTGSSVNADGEILIDEGGASGTPQTSAHVHTDDCYKMEKVLACLLAEGPGHTHTAACYDGSRQLICGHDGMAEIIRPNSAVGYVSTNDTGKILICGKKEHKHTDSCYPAETAQSETKAQTEETVTEKIMEAQTEAATGRATEVQTPGMESGQTAVETEAASVQSELQEETAAESEAAVQPEQQTETITEAATEKAAETERTTETLVSTGSETATERQTTVVTETEVTAEKEAETELTTETPADVETELATETQTELQTDAETEIISEAAEETETEAVTEPQTGTETEAENDTEPESEISTETEISTEIETGTDSEFDTEVGTEDDTEIETDAEIESETETEIGTEVESETEITTETESESETETESESDIETETEIEPETETESESDTGSESEIESETGVWTDEALKEAFKDGTIDSYCVVQRGIFSGSSRKKAAARAAVSQGAIEFGQYLTSSTVMKIQNGQWVSAAEFNDGDEVKVSLNYSLPANKVTPDQRQIYYQLPSGIRPASTQTGKAYHGGVAVGEYVIDTDGMITIDFYPEFANGDAFTGNIDFSGKVTFADAVEDGKITFGGTNSTITVKKDEEQEKYDLKTEKKGVLSEDKKQISYKITASTVNGTSDTVTIQDNFQSGNTKGTYKADTFKIYKISASGERTELSGYTPEFGTTNGQPSFKISDLPKLAPGEAYEVSYDADVTPESQNGESSISNSAGAKSGKTENWTWNTVSISKSMISKGGSYDADENVVNWTITVNEDKRDINGYQLDDPLNGMELVGEYVVVDSAGKEIGRGTTFPYTFENLTDPKDTYRVMFKTRAPESDQTVTNSATFGKDGDSFSAAGTAGVTHRTWGLSKRFDSEVSENNALRYKWQTNISLPAGDTTEFVYEDTILEPTDSNGASIEGDKHYAFAPELDKAIKESLKLKMKGVGETKFSDNAYVDFEIIYYDAEGKEVAADDNETHVQSFKVKVTPKTDVSFEWQSMYFEYKTVADYSGMEQGDTWTFKNQGKLGDISVEDKHSYTLPNPLKKYLKTTDPWGNIKYTDDTTKIDYDTSNGILTYRLLIRTTPDQKGELTVTDTLPDGAEYVEGSLEGAFYAGGENWEHTWKDQTYYPGSGQYTYRFSSDAQKPTCSIQDGKLVIKVKEGYNGTADTQLTEGAILALEYQISVKNDEYWEDLKNSSKYYTNSAQWENNKTDQKTEVVRHTDALEKTAEQLTETDEDGNVIKTKRVKYTIRINPAAENLDPNSDTLTLKDTLSGANGAGADLELDTVKLYHLDNSKPDGTGGEVATSDYRLQYDETKHQMTLVIPDETACVLVYVYAMDIGNIATPTYTNSVELTGIFKTGTESKLEEIQSSAGVQKKRFEIYKVDSDNHTKLLDGASFKLEAWKESKWTEVGTYEAKNGRLELNAAVGSDGLEYNILYRVTEEKAPTGYAKTDQEYYFVYMDPTTNPDNDTDKAWWTNGAGSAGVEKKNVIFVGKDGKTIYVPNKATSIKVQKVWVDSKGNTLSGDALNIAGIQVKVKRSTKKPQGYRVKLRFEYGGGTKYSGLNQSEFAGEIIVEPGSRISYRNGVAFHYPGDTWDKCYKDILIDGVPDTGATGYLDETTLHNGNAMYVVCTTGPITKDCTVTIRTVADWADSQSDSADVLMARVRYVSPGIVNETEDKSFSKVISLNKGNSWTEMLNDLEAADENGNPYYYTVEEVGGSSYNVVYTNNGIQTGTIYIKNTVPDKEDSYVLPETGGPGSRMYMIGGAMLAMLAAVLLYIKAVNRRCAADCATPSGREDFRNDCSGLRFGWSNKRGKEDGKSP